MANTNSLDLEHDSSQCAYISDASQTGLDVSGDMTIECWVKLESLPASANVYAFVSKYASGAVSYLFNMYNTGAVYLMAVAWSSDGSTASNPYVIFTPETGVWHHFAATIDVSAHLGEFFIDGTSVGSLVDGSQSSIFNSATDFIIGGFNSGASPLGTFDGLIDEVKVWNVVRTQPQIAADMESSSITANCVGYWKLNNDYLDETTNNNDLTAVNSPVFSSDVPFADYTITTNIKAVSGVTYANMAKVSSVAKASIGKISGLA